MRTLACSSHLEVEDDDPSVGEKFSVETLRQGDEGLRSIPSTVHGAPVSAEVQLRASCPCCLAAMPRRAFHDDLFA